MATLKEQAIDDLAERILNGILSLPPAEARFEKAKSAEVTPFGDVATQIGGIVSSCIPDSIKSSVFAALEADLSGICEMAQDWATSPLHPLSVKWALASADIRGVPERKADAAVCHNAGPACDKAIDKHRELGPADREKLERTVTAEAAWSRAVLSKLDSGVADKITVFRVVRGAQARAIQGAVTKGAKAIRVKTRPLSSWSMKEHIAEHVGFVAESRAVLTATVPVSQVWSHYAGNAVLARRFPEEQEIVLSPPSNGAFSIDAASIERI